MELEQVKQQTTWNDASESINSNFAKVDIEIEKLKNVTTRDKGYYQTVEALTAAHPTASVGSRAFVGYVAPYAVYVWDKATSKWVDTGETITDATLDLGDYYTKADVDNLVLAINRALGTKFGALYVDATTGLMSAFATEDDKQEWLETGNANLVLTQVNVGGGGGGGTADITIDTAMSDTSENAVANRVIKAYVDETTSNLADDIKDNPSTYIPLKTINGQGLYGEGDIEIEGGGAEITFLEFEINTDTMELVMAYEMSDGGALGFDFKLDSNGNLIATI